jgi:hypothetical protein
MASGSTASSSSARRSRIRPVISSTSGTLPKPAQLLAPAPNAPLWPVPARPASSIRCMQTEPSSRWGAAPTGIPAEAARFLGPVFVSARCCAGGGRPCAVIAAGSESEPSRSRRRPVSAARNLRPRRGAVGVTAGAPLGSSRVRAPGPGMPAHPQLPRSDRSERRATPTLLTATLPRRRSRMNDLVTVGSHDGGRQRRPLGRPSVPIPASGVPVQPAHGLRPAKQDHIHAGLAHRPAKTVQTARVLGVLKRRAGIRQFDLSRHLIAGEIALQVDEEVTHHDTFR